MRRAARTDSNQQEIVRALRQHGCSVQPIHTIGKGCPDLLVGWQGRNYLLEIKDGSKPPSARRLTADEKQWHERWQGQVAIVGSIDEAIKLIKRQEEYQWDDRQNMIGSRSISCLKRE